MKKSRKVKKPRKVKVPKGMPASLMPEKGMRVHFKGILWFDVAIPPSQPHLVEQLAKDSNCCTRSDFYDDQSEWQTYGGFDEVNETHSWILYKTGPALYLGEGVFLASTQEKLHLWSFENARQMSHEEFEKLPWRASRDVDGKQCFTIRELPKSPIGLLCPANEKIGGEKKIHADLVDLLLYPLK